MEITGIHHVAFAHGADSDLLPFLDLLGIAVGHCEEAVGFTERMADTGGGFLQLLEPTGDGTVARFVEKRGSGLHHVALGVVDLLAALDELRTAGVELIDDAPRPGGMGTSIAFVHPRATGGLLLELVEQPPVDHAG